MPKASVRLPNGTHITIEGETEEIKKILSHFDDSSPSDAPKRPKPAKSRKRAEKHLKSSDDKPDTIEIVNLIKECDESESIEKNILDRTGAVDRVLLPLYIVSQYLKNSFSLTTGEISLITRELGVPISTPNVSRALAGPASRYVIGDKRREKGAAVRYKLSRPGVQYLKKVITGESDGK